MIDDPTDHQRESVGLRSAVGYAAVVMLLALAAWVGYACRDELDVGAAMATPLVLWAGAVGAYGKAWWDWRAGRPGEAWHRAGWFLVALAIVACAVPATGLLQTPP